MTEWEPATETEAAMRDALRAGDQELYFRILARADLLLPVSAEALAGRTPMGWGTWTTGGRTHVLAFTSAAALRACLAENAGSSRPAPYPELAAGWPNPEWWLAVNPGLPIEGYLPAWFVSQLSRGDVRLPGRSMGARARLEQVERAARARATAAVPRRPPGGPSGAEPKPAAPFRPVEPQPVSSAVEPGPVLSAAEPASFSAVGIPATIPVIAPTPERRDQGGDFGSPISDDASAGWMTPAGPVQPAPATGTNGSAAAGQGSSAAPATPSPLSRGAPGGPPPAWYGVADRRPDQPTVPFHSGPPGERTSAPDAPEASSSEVRAPAAWTPASVRPEASLFTPGARRQASESRSGAGESWPDATVAGPLAASPPVPASRTSAEPAPTEPTPTEPTTIAAGATEPISTGPGLTRSLSPESFPTEPIGSSPMKPIESFSTEPLPAGSAPVGTPTAGRGAADPVYADPVHAIGPRTDFVPANDVERSLLGAAGDGSTDTFLSTLLLATVLLPVASRSSPGARPEDDGFEWRTESLDGETYVVVFTSPERLGDHLPGSVETVAVKFAQLIRRWPDESWSFAVNPGTPVGAKLPGGQIVALASWAAEVGLGDDADAGEQAPPAPAEEAPRSTYAPAREDPGRPTVMQKTIAPSQLSYYLDRGYDRVSGFVHRGSEVAHLRTPAQLYAALGLGYPGSPFARDAEEIYILRWPAYRPSLYRIPYGGQSEAAMRAMEGWVIERPPFRGNGFAPGESSDVVAEFKVDSVRLPHGARLYRIGGDGSERLVATLNCDGPLWHRAEEE